MSDGGDKLYERAKRIARTVLNEFTTPQREQFDEAIATATSACPGVDTEALARELETLYNVFLAEATVLEDPAGHEPWLTARSSLIQWDFWSRYEMYMEQDKHLPPLVLARLHELTNRTLALIEDPERPGSWDRRGMVVGQVQSGKTANYIGLVCKAADAGYNLIVIMAGIHNSLRSQTQLRLDEGFQGQDTKLDRVFKLDSPRIGVGKYRLPSGRTPAAHSMTTSDERGDFKKAAADSVGIYVGGNQPVVLVIKKNGSILKNLLKWVLARIAEKEGDRKIVPGRIRLLLIDDEADNASINTNKLEEADGRFSSRQEVTRINSLIRQLLSSFTKSAYVGFTATPFANIFIPPDASSDDLGDDLFPRSFIINLPAPSNYVGPVQVFGDGGLDASGQPGLPIVRNVLDSESVIPPVHKKELVPSTLPDSLKEAIRAFILVCAARIARGQHRVHNSMLVHVTRFVAVQAIVRDLVLSELQSMRRRLVYGEGATRQTLRDELHDLWQRDFEPTSDAVRTRIPDDAGLAPVSWTDVDRYLTAAIDPIEVKLINGTATDVLDYYDNQSGCSIIAVGGDKLSRGLTLEGLSVSYYLRATRMYDTLMQMGRWFGYRPGYVDLCRLYTTPELIGWYRHITVASEELRDDFDVMAAQGLTPAEYGLKVQTHPGGLTVTSAGKIRYGTKLRVSFSLQLVESHRIVRLPQVVAEHYAVADAFVRQLGGCSTLTPITDHHVWEHVPAESVVDYLNCLQPVLGLPPVPDPGKLASFISLKNRKGALTEWTVALISSSAATARGYVGGLPVGFPVRTPDEASTNTVYVIRNRHILTEAHEWIDLSVDERARAVSTRNALYRAKSGGTDSPFDEPNGISARLTRPLTRGLLLLYPLDPSKVMPQSHPPEIPVMGYAISFPGTNRAEDMEDAVEYVVNRTYIDEELSGYRHDEELNRDAA